MVLTAGEVPRVGEDDADDDVLGGEGTAVAGGGGVAAGVGAVIGETTRRVSDMCANVLVVNASVDNVGVG